MNRKEILETASKIISEDREEQYGSPRANFKAIANLWSAYLIENCSVDCAVDGVHISTSIRLSSLDVAIMMALLKIARMCTGEPKADNYVDAAGYIALAGELEGKHD